MRTKDGLLVSYLKEFLKERSKKNGSHGVAFDMVREVRNGQPSFRITCRECGRGECYDQQELTDRMVRLQCEAFGL